MLKLSKQGRIVRHDLGGGGEALAGRRSAAARGIPAAGGQRCHSCRTGGAGIAVWSLHVLVAIALKSVMVVIRLHCG